MKAGLLTVPSLLAVVVGIAICVAYFSRYQESESRTLIEPMLEPTVFSNALDTNEINSIFNEEGRRFIRWTRMKVFWWVVPDEHGVIRKLEGDICSFPNDEEIGVVAKLSGLHTLWVRADRMTDVSLGHLAKNQSLKVLYLLAPEQTFTKKGLQTFSDCRPDVALRL